MKNITNIFIRDRSISFLGNIASIYVVKFKSSKYENENKNSKVTR